VESNPRVKKMAKRESEPIKEVEKLSLQPGK